MERLLFFEGVNKACIIMVLGIISPGCAGGALVIRWRASMRG